MNLSALVGNDRLKQQLTQQQGRGGLGHAYVISGPPGSGRKTLAGLLCAAMLCTASDALRPCTLCPQCKKALSGIHPDVSALGEGEKPISIEQVRALRADAHIRPNEGSRKVYILHQAQQMTPAAQNALLKLLEEGPAYAAFLLLTDQPDAILGTVRSRCQQLALSPVGREDAKNWLSVRFPDKSIEAIDQAVTAAQGILGRAAADENAATHDAQATAHALAQAMESGAELALFQAAMPLDKLKREGLIQVLEELEQELGRKIVQAPSLPLLRGADLTRALRSAAALNANPGQLAGWLCAGMFL